MSSLKFPSKFNYLISNLVEPKKEQTQESAGAQEAEETGGENRPEGEGEEEKKEETTEETKKEETPKGSGGILPGMGDDKPHTSVKVRAPPGGKSSITF